MKKAKLVLIGGGGHCKSCIDVIEQQGQFEIVGILDVPQKQGETILGYKIIGSDDDCEKLHNAGCVFLITVGQIKTASVRKNIFEKLQSIDAEIVSIVSPHAYISKYANIAKGTIVMHNVVVNAGSSVGQNCILNTGCTIEHDAKIGNHTHVSTGVFVNGDCNIGNEVFIGSNTTIINQIAVGNNVVIGAGSVIVKNINNNKIAIGNPTREIEI
jgi:sugar O-acyltransferase (sialic acid O-acetyltransferase NeuD family)